MLSRAQTIVKRARRRALRRALRVGLAAVVGICAWDDSTDLHWEPHARAIAADHAPAATADIAVAW